jgi:catechol 2,3-dioxygenase-like lactoylglutathione lyase family enzyme
VHLFHYHLVTSKVREAEERYLAKLGFSLVARHGRVGEQPTSFEPGTPWTELDRMGFRLRLTELERGGVNVVVQPGHWTAPRVDHLGVALDEGEFRAVLARAALLGRRVQEHGGRRTFVATPAGYRLEIHPPREWIDELLRSSGDFHLAELHLRADSPGAKAQAIAELLGLDEEDGRVEIGDTVVAFVEGGPEGRPVLDGELFGEAPAAES